MNDFIKTLLNIRSLRAALRELPFEQLVEIKSKFDEVFANSTSKCDTRLCRLTVLFEYLDRLPESETFPRS